MLHNPLAQRQADTCSAIFPLRVQPCEQAENPLLVLRLDSDSVVSHRETPFAVPPLRGHMDHGSRIRFAVFYGVPQKILEQLP